MYIMEVDECYEIGQLIGYVAKIFPGVPSNLIGSFRYTNGKLYFNIEITCFWSLINIELYGVCFF